MASAEQQPIDPASAAREAEFARLRKSWHVYRPHELQQECERKGQRFVIESLIPECSLGILVGDSGLGKSPLAYQMGICVSAGIPFLGMATQKTRVLYLDYENGLQDVNNIVTRQAAYLGLPAPPEDLILWNINDSPLDWGQAGRNITDLIRAVKPGLVFADPLSAVHPDIEKNNSDATTFYQILRKVIRDVGCSIFNLHHRKKPPSPKPGQVFIVESLEDELHPRDWFRQARGAGVIVNGTDIRLGVDVAGMSGAEAEVALVLRGFGRVRGDIPTLHLARAVDADGEPMAYRRLSGVELLCNPDQEHTFTRLPDRFAFKDAKQTYNKGDQATTDFLKKCIAKGILHKVSKGVYEKVKIAE
jgi:hypothetical protein